MSDTKGGLFSCRNMSWMVGGLLGLVAFLLVSRASVLLALLVAIALAVAVALLLQRIFCIGQPADAGVMGSELANAGGAALDAVGAGKTRAASEVPGAGERERSVEAAAAAHTQAVAAAAGNQGESASRMEEAALDTAKSGAASRKSETPVAEKRPAKKPAKTAASEARPKAAKPATSKTKTASAGPELLDKPRGGKGDDLKQIKGVGPKFEALLNSVGVWHFDQIASWKKADIAVVDAKLTGFHGRIERDGWVAQAKKLAKGEDTAFSTKVKKGGVY